MYRIYSLQKFNEQRKGVHSSRNISRILVTNLSSDLEQLKKARDDIKELIKETYCSPILVYNGKFCLGLGILTLASTFTFVSSFSHWALNVRHDLNSCCDNFKGKSLKIPMFIFVSSNAPDFIIYPECSCSTPEEHVYVLFEQIYGQVITVS